ncbi:phage tail tape measure protein [Paenibacillus cineris]|uniref:phage tail tape measure protein n=1 Tax=Paenibacillus cineris TaxID=237530 RepID=UPI001B2CB3F2|nr:phage tail tape measure protein [Paenibacillus cineris]GIO63582.1 hypothetical protein J43TS9_51560 [Paenibacillus cineris]
MAETIKGINVVIGADTTGLSKALTDVNKKSRDIQSELKQVDKLLKFDPGNTDLLAQKQKLLSDAIVNTSNKLNSLRAVQQQVSDQFAKGDITEGQYRAFEREVAKTEQELSNLDSKLDQTTKTLKEQGVAVSQLGKDYQESFQQAQQALGNSFEQMKKLGTGITAAGAGIAAGLGVAVKSAADFEQSMANVYSVMSPEEVSQFKGELKDLAVTMGADTKYSATEAAQGIEELIKAGVSVKDVMGGGLKGALSLATAGELDLADAAEIASTALNAFRDDNLSVQRAADLLAGAANASATSVSEMKFGLAQVSAVASGVGLSFEDTATALALFAQNGLKGSDAGTSLKTMLTNLTPKTNAAYGSFRDLGLLTVEVDKALKFMAGNGIKAASDSVEDIEAAIRQYAATQEGLKVGTNKAEQAYRELAANVGIVHSKFYDANGDLKDMTEISNILQEALKDLNGEQRNLALYSIFGSDAIRAGNILFKEGAKGITEMNEAMNKITADQVAAQKLDTFKGSIEQLTGAMETAMITIGDALLPALRSLTDFVQKGVDVFNAMPEGFKSFVAISGAVVAALALITGPLLILIGFIPQIVAGFTMVGTVTSALGPVFAALTGPIGIVIAAVTALIAIFVALYKNNEDFRNKVNEIWKNIQQAFTTALNAIKDVVSSVMKGVTEFFGSQLNEIKQFWDKNGKDIMSVVKVFMDAISANIKATMGIIQGIFEAVWPIIQNVVKVAWEAIKLTISTVLDVIKRMIMIWIDLFKGDWKGAWNEFKGIFTDIWDNIVQFLKNIDLRQIGKDIMQGLLNGIKSMKDSVVNAAKDIANSVGDSVKDFFGIHSPSRLMLGYGKNIVQGLANGISGTASQAVQSASALSGAVAGAIQNNVNGLSVAASSAMGGMSGGSSNTYNMEGMFSGAVFQVRKDEDIRAISREIWNMAQQSQRGTGGPRR